VSDENLGSDRPDADRLTNDVEEWKRLAQAAEARFEVVVDHVPNAVLIFDEAGALAFANRAAHSRLDIRTDPAGSSPATVEVGRNELERIRLEATPTLWHGRPASMVLLSDPGPSLVPTVTADTLRTGRRSKDAPPPFGEPVQDAAVFRCVLEELPALRDVFGSDLCEGLMSTVLDRLRAFVHTQGDVSVLEGSNALLVMQSHVDSAEAQRLAHDIQAIAQEPVAVNGISIRLTAVVSVESGIDMDDPEPEGSNSEADRRRRIRGALFSEPDSKR